ncbi:MAG TPA: asparaginase domain-containing protein [Solimonas sp.]
MPILKVFTTGGTIDKIYFDAASQYEIGEPQIGRVLQGAGVAGIEICPLMRKDSLQMDDADRARVREAVQAESCQRILITHGTDTMAQTALALGDCGGKTVVFTGAMQPARFHETDAVFNIGFALGVALSSPPGVYLAMNGRVFDPAHVRKNREAGRFESL